MYYHLEGMHYYPFTLSELGPQIKRLSMYKPKCLKLKHSSHTGNLSHL